MSTKTSFRLLFYINANRINQLGETPIYLRITMNARFVTLSIKRSIKPDNWDQHLGRCRGRTVEATEINNYIEAFRGKVLNKYTELISIYEQVTPELLRDTVFCINSAKSKTICDIWEDHVLDLKKLIDKGSSYTLYQKFNTALRYFKDFLQQDYRMKDISVKLIDRVLVVKFEIYLRTNKLLSYNTTIKYLQNFKTVVIIAMKNGWLKVNPFIDFKLTLHEVDRPYLSENEIQKLLMFDMKIQRLELVRDLFIFSCFSGLAYSDLFKLKRSEIETDANVTLWIKTRRQKTKIRTQIPLLEIPRMILEKYTDLSKLKAEDKVLPVLSNQKLNAYLKEILTISGIEKTLTFHVARHTFATTVTMMNGVPIESVSRMLGHTNIKTTQHYARIVDAKIGNDIMLLAQKLNGRYSFNQHTV
ncbi:MAG: hypothetical protein AUJ98_01420 [Bacteroidetes bacterium CG2_30_33_31]|nr:MAG: hypothetical protein AUJ98_01420 [Bacteroidetes bacterium CG2_30_33_31]